MGVKQTIVVVAAVLVLSRLIFGATPTVISPAALETIITQHTAGTTDFILVDVRDNSEVKDGIIASEYCKPYHLSWNFGKFDSSFQMLPKSKRIIIYCRSGSRSNQAAAKLLGAGYDSVGSMTGGINSYKGKLADSAEFKPLSKLPEASYFGISTTISRNKQRYRTVVPSEQKRYQFTLQGRAIRPTEGRQRQNAPIYILERIGDETSQKINGLHRLIQEKE